jgi:hypothetical protein
MEIWRLVMENVATLSELETTWSLDDVMRANAVLSMQKTIESTMLKKAGKK